MYLYLDAHRFVFQSDDCFILCVIEALCPLKMTCGDYKREKLVTWENVVFLLRNCETWGNFSSSENNLTRKPSCSVIFHPVRIWQLKYIILSAIPTRESREHFFQAFLKMWDPITEPWKMIIFYNIAFIQPLARQNVMKKMACQMPNLAYFWHFPMVADRVVAPSIKIDQPCKAFLKLVLEMPYVPKCKIWHTLGISQCWKLEQSFL